jgi:poly-gamma-glutamate synthesis protein (capsule biosynthesis protein)
MVLQPRKAFREFAHAVLDMGVDLVHGHSAHVFHGVEIYRRQLILYDTGDFLDDYAIDPELRNDWSFVFLVDLEGSKAKRLRMVPVELEFAEVKLARGQVQEQIRQRMRTLCEPFGIRPADTETGLEVVVGRDSLKARQALIPVGADTDRGEQPANRGGIPGSSGRVARETCGGCAEDRSRRDDRRPS